MPTNSLTTTKFTRYAVAAAAASVGVVLLAACASSGPSASTSTPAGGSVTSVQAGGGPTSASTTSLKTESTSIGTVAASSTGMTLYELVGDTTANPSCTGKCLTIWPAVMAGGTQVVLQGHPAYTFTGDTAPGQATGEAVKDQWGTWYALDSNGKPIIKSAAPTTKPASKPSKSSGGGGGYGY